MELNKSYNPQDIEDKWYEYWTSKGYFTSEPNEKPAFTIVIPPPNVTGVLHMGHMLNNTIQDVLIRRARMLGYNACWVPGTDHASIATEAKVVDKLKKEGISKNSLTREEFLEHAWEWKEKHGGIILEQLKKLGASCDWKRTNFTMNEDYSESVIDVFIDLHEKGLIYRGTRMVNWDPVALTAVSDEEVIHKEVNGKLYYIKYKIEGEDEFVTIATTRPETILGDTAICINPTDNRFKHLHGKRAIIPLINKSIPIILDEYVDTEFGTGCLKVTPAHDVNDYELGKKHNLESVDILDEKGKLNNTAKLFVGEDRFDVRKKIPKELEKVGALVKIDDYTNKVGFSERSDAVIEPRLSMQWYVSMEKLSKPALDAVMTDKVKFHPPKFKNTYRHWMENIKDWCISRQLWWGHRIPAWYGPNNEIVVAKTVEEALKKFNKKGIDCTVEDIKQDEDVLDTWFSSWLWPISVFDAQLIKNGKENANEELRYYYPTKDLVTAPEIMFFWVARMIMAGYEYLDTLPFENVYFTGIVRDKQGRKMSKSLGNSPDPIELMKKYGADGVRVGMLLSSPAGNDLLFDESLCEQGRNFSNKIWNAYRLINGWEVAEIEQPKASKYAIKWFENKLQKALIELKDYYSKFRMSDALMTTYKLVWDDFCSWYLEMIKPAYKQPIDKETFESTITLFEQVLKILHPFMPFISEELWQHIKERKDNEALIVSSWPKITDFDSEVINSFNNTSQVISGIRNIRLSKNIPNKEQIELHVKTNSKFEYSKEAVLKLGNISTISSCNEKPNNAFGFIIGSNEFFIPFSENIDLGAEIDKINKELDYTKGFLASISKKLSNERFVNNAPEQVVANEKKKLEDAEARIKVLEEQLDNLN